MHIHVVIVGGGIGGLYSAYKYINDGYNVVLIEKNDRLGGRIHTIYNTNYQYEAGAGRMSKMHTNLMRLINTFNLTVTPLSKTKTYRSIACGEPVAKQNASSAKITKVCKLASKYSKEQLSAMTFNQLCTDILGVEQTNQLVNEFGYNGEFAMNASDAVDLFGKDFTGSKQYYICKEGLSELVNRMESMLLSTNRIKIFKNCEAITVKQNKQFGYMKVVAQLNMGDTRVFKSDVVIAALPKNELKVLIDSSVTDAHKKLTCINLLNTVETVPLHRVYGKFSSTWFDGINATTTDDSIRQFIPIDTSSSIAMVSYSDTQHADYWNQYAQLGDKQLRTALLKHLHVVFPEVKLPRMQWVQNHYWQAGVHAWKQGINSKAVREKVQQIHGTDIPFFIVGEAYSSHQSWIEGALVSVEDVYSKTVPFLKNEAMGGSQAPKIPRVKSRDLAKFVADKGIEYWVTLRSNGKLRLMDTTEWMNKHPGGDWMFQEYNHRDITDKLNKDHYTGDPKYKMINPRIMNYIDKITVAFVVT